MVTLLYRILKINTVLYTVWCMVIYQKPYCTTNTTQNMTLSFENLHANFLNKASYSVTNFFQRTQIEKILLL